MDAEHRATDPAVGFHPYCVASLQLGGPGSVAGDCRDLTTDQPIPQLADARAAVQRAALRPAVTRTRANFG
jgi:hypothetical protein